MRVMYNNDYYMMFRSGGITIHHKYPGNVEQWIYSDNTMHVGLLSDADIWDGDGNIATGDLNDYRRAHIRFLKGSDIDGSKDYIDFFTNGHRPRVWFSNSDGSYTYKGYIMTDDLMNSYLKCDSNGDFNADYAANADYAKSAGSANNATNAGYATSAGSASNATNASNAINATNATIALKCKEVATSSHTSNCYIQGDSSKSSYKTIYLLPSGSSRRYKTNVEIVNDACLDPHRLYNLDVVQFKYKPSFFNLPEGTDMPTVIGLIAEDVNEKYPCACEYNEENGQVENWLERYMIPPMLYLIQEQHKDIELLKQENLASQNRISILEQKMEVINR